MPFGQNCEYPNFKACADKMSGKVDNPEAYCATLMRRTEEHCKGAPTNGVIALSVGEMREICPSCADKMASLNITSLKVPLSEFREIIAKAPQNLAAMCDKMGADPGVFRRCMDMVSGWELDNKEGFCNWLHEQCTGHTPGEDSAEGLGTNLALLESQAYHSDMVALEAFSKGEAPAPVLYKPLGRIKAVEGGIMTFVASEESEDRMGDVVKVDGWVLDNYMKNPVFLYGHDHAIPPIGSVPKVWVEGKQLLNMVKWDDQDAFAQFVKGKYERGFMRGLSVGFRPLEPPTQRKGVGQGMEFGKQELLEISAVAVPAHPSAVLRALGGRHFNLLNPPKQEIQTEPDILGELVSEMRKAFR